MYIDYTPEESKLRDDLRAYFARLVAQADAAQELTTEPRVVTLPGVARAPAPLADLEDRPLLEALHGWRRDRARAASVPAYVVAHDAALLAIAAERPQTLAALRRVKGMGPMKLESYGEEILAIIAANGTVR